MGVNGYIQELEDKLALWQLLTMILYTKCVWESDHKAALGLIYSLIEDDEELQQLENKVLCSSGGLL